MGRFQPAITIYEAIRRISDDDYLLPAFQREFEWKADRITRLFDSLMKGYPISSMLFWRVKGDTKASFKFYRFLDRYVEDFYVHNQSVPSDRKNDFHAVLDGQQRLTSIYISLCGSFAAKEYNKHRSHNETNYPTRHLYLNISKDSEPEAGEEFYNFQFLPKSETLEKELYSDKQGDLWFRCGRIISLHESESYSLDEFMDDQTLVKKNKEVLRKFDKLIFNKDVINFYEEDDQKPDKAVNIFIRINSGGISLSFSKIMMAVAVANWQIHDARSEIFRLVDFIKSKGFSANEDFILKSFLYLYHKDIGFKVNNFNNDFMKLIEGNWPNIRDCIESLFELIRTFGLNDYTLTSNNATLPILYYLYHLHVWKDFSTLTAHREERERIRKWLYSVLVRRTFGGQSDTILTQARRGFTDDISVRFFNTGGAFPSAAINAEIRRMSAVDEEVVSELVGTQKDSQYSFPILAMLYPNLDYRNGDFHQDHTHPAVRYAGLDDTIKEKIDWKMYNSILNLQMLDANENMSKNDMALELWVNEQTQNRDRAGFLASHLIPDVSLREEDIVEYFQKRKRILTDKMLMLLNG